VGVAAVASGGTAIALAAGGSGPAPPLKPLAPAVHDALAAPAVQGVTARIRFTNHLVSAASLGGAAGPVVTGATGRLWASPDGHVRLELQSDRGDAQIVSDGASWWAYDASSNTVYRGQLPQHQSQPDSSGTNGALPSVAEIQRHIDEAMQHLGVSGAQPTDVAGQPAYTVRVTPKGNGGLVGGAELAWDAARGVPLRVAVFARGDTSPVVSLEATGVSFRKVDPAAFAVQPPAGARTVDVALPQGGRHQGNGSEVTGLRVVRAQAGFPVAAPDSVAGMPREDVRLVQTGHGNAALVTYGQGLGGIAVLQTKDDGAGRTASTGLPLVTIGRVKADELDTPLGTLVHYTRGGVATTLAGSVTPATAKAAVRDLAP
jgi:outer membrane lipoprotein-sorting protein